MSNIFVDDEHLASEQARGGGDDLPATPGGDRFLIMAANAYRESSSFWETNFYRTWQHSLANFRNQHPRGSKYHTDAYARRSRLFRPKTRSAVLRGEAAANMAFFATEDTVTVSPEDEESALNVLAAEIRKELLNYRTTCPDQRWGMPWFLTAIGAFQDCEVMGAVCSYQDWLYEEREITREVPVKDDRGQSVLDGETGEPWHDEITETVVVKDRPDCRLVPLENIRFHAAADWRDPVNSSPYFIEIIPMYVYEIRERMAKGEWDQIDNVTIAKARTDRHDAVRQEREGRERKSGVEEQSAIHEFTTVWVHRNIVRHGGRDVVYHTLGVHARLEDPKPLDEVYPQGRPYVLGTCMIETHRIMPSSPVEIASGVQAAANDIRNQRFDNVRLVLNKRYFALRNAGVDVHSLRRSEPGGVTFTDDLNAIKPDDMTDVTSSAYAEEDRNNVDMDDIMGTFSAGTVQSNRKLNETVGGMNLMSQDANVIMEHKLRIFGETWVEKVLNQIDRLEMEHESDARVLMICGQKSKAWKQVKAQYQAQYGQAPQLTPELLQMGGVAVRVSVGYGSTNPTGRIEKLMLGMNVVATTMPAALQRIKQGPLINEVFGILGWQSGNQFFQQEDDEQDPRLAQLEQMVQQLQQEIATEAHKVKAKTEGDLALAREKAQHDGKAGEQEMAHKERLAQLEAEQKRFDRQMQAQESFAKLALDRADLALKRDEFRAGRGDAQFEQQQAKDEFQAGRDDIAFERKPIQDKHDLADSVEALQKSDEETAEITSKLLARLDSMDQMLVALSGAGSEQAKAMAQRLDEIADEVEAVAAATQSLDADAAAREVDRKAIRKFLMANASDEVRALVERTSNG
jgi:hypothetical protein